MASDQQVSATLILRSLNELNRRGVRRILAELEQVEPALAEHLMEGLSDINRGMLTAGLSPREQRRLYRQVQQLVLVCIMALRKGHYELWKTQDAPAEADDALLGPASQTDAQEPQR